MREATIADADLLELWHSSRDQIGEFNDFDQPRHVPVRAAIAAGTLINEHGGRLVVERTADGLPLGTVSWHAVRYGPNPESFAWNIGITLAPAARGKGYGGEAQRRLARFLFATTRVNRVEACTDVDNRPEQRALEKAGFHREGVVRGAQYRAGSWHDLWMFAVVRSDLEANDRDRPVNP